MPRSRHGRSEPKRWQDGPACFRKPRLRLASPQPPAARRHAAVACDASAGVADEVAGYNWPALPYTLRRSLGSQSFAPRAGLDSRFSIPERSVVLQPCRHKVVFPQGLVSLATGGQVVAGLRCQELGVKQGSARSQANAFPRCEITICNQMGGSS